jgi:hypothetical protein
MLAEDRRSEPGHPAADHRETSLLEAAEDLAGEALLHAVGFEDDEGSWHRKPRR